MKRKFEFTCALLILIATLTVQGQKYIWEYDPSAIINGDTVCNAFDGGFSTGIGSPTLFDIDQDGDCDFFYKATSATIGFIENTGSSEHPCWIERTSYFANIYLSQIWAPYFADIDGDGKPDLITGDYRDGGNGGTVHCYKNTSVGNNYSFVKVSDTLAGLKTYDDSDPTACDVNQDGLVDLVVGDGLGDIYYVENNGNNQWGVPRIIIPRSPNNWADDKASPELNDIDGDGIVELLVGRAQTHTIELYKPTITPDTITWTLISNNYLPELMNYFLYGGNFITPMAAKFDGDSLTDLLLCSSGEITFIKNIGTPTAPVWDSCKDVFPFFQWGGYKTYVFDMNNDGKDEMLIRKPNANYFIIYRNDNVPSMTPDWIYVKGLKTDSLLQGIPNLEIQDMAFFRYDEDSLIDIVVKTKLSGTSQATVLKYFRNISAPTNYKFQYVADTSLENIMQGNTYTYIEEGDINDNGKEDILLFKIQSWPYGNCEWYEHSLTPVPHWDMISVNFQPSILDYISWNPTIQDFDNDGLTDLLLPGNTFFYKKTDTSFPITYTAQLPNSNYTPSYYNEKMEFANLDGYCGTDMFTNTGGGMKKWSYRGIQPKITAPLATTYNICDSAVTQLTAQPTGGTWGGGCNADGTFIPSHFYAPGNYWLTYNYLDPQGCYTRKDSLKITITATTPVPVITRNIRNVTIVPEQSLCFAATNEILTGGNDSVFLVQAGGQARLLAGQKIIMLTGTHVEAGGNLYAKITHNCLWCDGVQNKNSLADYTNSEFSDTILNSKKSIMVHPNPTKGSFSVDLGEITCCGCRLEVVDIMGKAVLKSELNPTGKGEFSINNVTPGLYFLRIFADNQVLTEKLIKY